MRIIAIATTMAVAGVPLHQTIQTTAFVQQWHRDASSAWGSQTHTGPEANGQLVDSENAVLLLGDRAQNLKLQIHLKCDWNISSFRVTLDKCNQSAYTWDQLSKHLRGHVCNNLSLDISQLQATISNTLYQSSLVTPRLSLYVVEKLVIPSQCHQYYQHQYASLTCLFQLSLAANQATSKLNDLKQSFYLLMILKI